MKSVVQRSATIILPVLFLAPFLWTADAWGRAADRRSSGSQTSRDHFGPVGPSPAVLCGCTDVLKNFA
jgi:hypothetical protein